MSLVTFHLRFQRTLPSFASSNYTTIRQFLRMRSAVAKSRFSLRHCVLDQPLDLRSSAHSPGRHNPSAGSLPHRCHPSQRTRVKGGQKTPASRRHPLAKLALVITMWPRAPGQTRPPGSRGVQGLPRARRRTRRGFRDPRRPGLFAPLREFSLLQAVREFRSRSTELAACCKPSKVKLSCFGTERSRGRSAARRFVVLSEQIAQCIEIASDGHFLPSTAKCSACSQYRAKGFPVAASL